MNDYQKILSKLYQLADVGKKTNYTLDRVFAAYKQLNYPGSRIPMVHVAGTNGKGSVAYKIAGALFESGYQTALFTSPHISSFRERMQINFQMVSKEEFTELMLPFFDWKEKKGHDLSFFECLVLVALQYFEKRRVDIAVIETGLGGRLDATNIIHPILSMIVSIGFDHCHILGDTLDEIAFEKGGIIKPNIPVVIGPSSQYDSIFSIAKKNNSPCHVVDGDFSSFDEENQSVANKGLEILKTKFRIKDVSFCSRPPCRMEMITYKDKQVILDVAHNTSGFMQLKKSLSEKSFEIYIGISKDKDIEGICKIVNSMTHKVYLIEDNHPRLEKIDKLIRYLKTRIQIHNSFQSILDQLENPLLVCGSFFIMSKVRAVLLGEEERDEVDLNERYISSFKKSKNGESSLLIH